MRLMVQCIETKCSFSSFRDFVISCGRPERLTNSWVSKSNYLAWLTISSYRSSGILLVNPVVRGMMAPAFNDGKFLNSWFGLEAMVQQWFVKQIEGDQPCAIQQIISHQHKLGNNAEYVQMRTVCE